MTAELRVVSFDSRQLPVIVEFSLRAWAPVFDSIQAALAPDVYREFYPDWRQQQQQAVQAACTSPDLKVWVAVDGASPVGFTAVRLHAETCIGEIHMLAVDPDFQGRGIGRTLTSAALQWMKEAGMSVAMVETGGDPGHKAARHTYESAGFGLLPIARYFKKL